MLQSPLNGIVFCRGGGASDAQKTEMTPLEAEEQ